MVLQLVVIGMTDNWTSITLRQETKQELNEHREDDESWDTFLNRWLNNDPPEQDKSLARIEEQLDKLDEAVAQAVIERLQGVNY